MNKLPFLGCLIKFAGVKEQNNTVECHLLRKSVEFHSALYLFLNWTPLQVYSLKVILKFKLILN